MDLFSEGGLESHGDIVGLLPANGQWANILEWQAVRPSWKRKYLVWFSPALNFVRLSS